ncbi:MAG: gamma-glutamyltransferase [Myxococcales bacterium]|nr:gamma-glutamyltransferase [Myxococcales bacterium]
MRGVVAAGDPRTAEAARDVLADGGNAVDAAVAGAFTAFVAEPLLASAAGAGMMTIALPDAPPLVVDFFSTMPGLGGTPDRLDFHAVEVDFGATTQTFHVGRGSVATPAALPGLLEAARRFGTRPLSALVAAAARHAREGLTLSAENAMVYSLLWAIQRQSPEAVALAGGALPDRTTRLVNPALADLLEEVASLDAVPPRFTRALLDAFGPGHGGLLSPVDLERAAPRLVEPRRIALGEWTVLTSPHVGGARVARLVGELTSRAPETDEAEEAARIAVASRNASARDPGGRGSTTHVSVMDAAGGAASVTLTNGEGCGFVAPGTGVQPNNFLGEEDLNPDGFHHHAPGTVLPTMIAPTVALRHGRPRMALGSGGSNRIRSVVSQVLYRVIALGATLEEAVLAPRVHAEGDDVWLERAGWRDPDAVERALEARFARVHPFPGRAFYFGGVHAVRATGDGEAVGDPRRGGAVASV